MEIIKGSLDDISRPASSELTGSRVSSVSLSHSDRVRPTTPFALVVLTNDSTRDIQSPINSAATGPDKGQCPINATDEEKDDSKLQRAMEEMRRLDELLDAEIFKEKEVKRQRKELQAKLWQELLQSKSEGHAECAYEALNTRLFLALEAPIGTETETEVDFVPLFETQLPDGEQTGDSHYLEESEMGPESWSESFEICDEEKGEEQFEGSLHAGASKGKTKQRDFVKRNIELVSGEGGQVHLTVAEKARLAELLREEGDEDTDRGADAEEDMWAVSVLTGQGYTPEPSDLEQLIDIDSKMRLLLPVEEFLSAQSSYTNLSLCQGRGPEVGWKRVGDQRRRPGEAVLQDIKERRGQERRLQQIQEQLEILGRGQETTDESPGLTEEQLLSLLDECELTESWTQDLETNDSTP